MAIGRSFTPADDQPNNPQPLVILRNNFWKRNLGSDPDIIGKPMMLNGTTTPLSESRRPGLLDLKWPWPPTSGLRCRWRNN